MTELHSLARGDAPVIVNVPHAGRDIPADIARRMTDAGRRQPDTDWHVDALYGRLAAARGITLMAARLSRYVVDLNRDPGGAVLYPGASNTEICPTTTFHDEEIYLAGEAPSASEVAARIARYWQPCHDALAAEVARVTARHGYCILLDGHSIVSVAPRFFEGRLPDLNLGTASGASAGASVVAAAESVLARADGFSFVRDGRFKGGYITRHYGRPEQGVHALQLEMAQCCYLDEANPQSVDESRAARLARVLDGLLAALLAWRPSLGGPGKK